MVVITRAINCSREGLQLRKWLRVKASKIEIECVKESESGQ